MNGTSWPTSWTAGWNYEAQLSAANGHLVLITNPRGSSGYGNAFGMALWQMWEKLSPWNDIDKVTTPTLFMGGESDWKVPILNSEQMYQALRRRGIDTRLVVYPGQPHGIRVPSYNVHRYQEYLVWYGKCMRGEGGSADGG